MYSIDPENQLIPLRETGYAREFDLQSLIAAHPSLLGGEQMEASSPRRFVVATVEAGIAIAADGGNVFSLDLLFLDQDAVLTLVEVKRSSDTRLRREVIGQLLDYAANVCAFWSAEKVRAVYEKTCEQHGRQPAAFLSNMLELNESDYEAYWDLLRSNLAQQRLRLVLVADKIPLETLRIVEYLNRQMASTDVFAVSVSEFTGGPVRTLSTRVLNPSFSQSERKATSSGRRGLPWSRQRFYEALSASQPLGAVHVMRAIDEWAQATDNVETLFGSGLKDGSIIIVFKSHPNAGAYRPGQDVVFLTLWTYGTVEVDFQYLAAFAPSSPPEFRLEYLRRLNHLGFGFPEDRISKRPSVPWTSLDDATRMVHFLDSQRWLVEELRKGARG